MEMRTVGIIIGVIALVAIVGAAFLYIYLSQPANTSIANPASVNCIEKGGTLEIRKFTNGETGFCVFPDGSECEEWKLMRNECNKGQKFCMDKCGDGSCQEIVCQGTGCPCAENSANCAKDCGNASSEVVGIANPASVNCIEKGGTLEMRETTEGTVGFCIFNDGSECEEWALMRKECKMGDILCRGQCGDGVCQSNVCMGSGCPCAESSANCALDCGMMVGNDSDANGCKASAGYSWCEVKQKCLRVWEENCTSALEDEALVFCGKPAVASVYTCGEYIQSVSSLPGAGTTFYLNGSIIARCPVVAPDMVSEQCKQLTLGNNCVQEKVC